MSAATIGQSAEIIGKLRDVSRSKVQRLIDNWDLVEALLEADAKNVDRRVFEELLGGTISPEVQSLLRQRFTSPEQQVYNLRNWNNKAGRYFSEEQLDVVLAEIPEFDRNRPLVALTLCWTLNTLEQTVATKLEILQWVYGADKVLLSDYLKAIEEGDVYLPEGAPEFVANRLWWEITDLDANRDKAPDQVDSATAAGTQLLDVACQHPVYIGQHNGGDTPYLDVPGLRIKVPGASKPHAPYIHGLSVGSVHVLVPWADDSNPGYAEPVVLRES